MRPLLEELERRDVPAGGAGSTGALSVIFHPDYMLKPSVNPDGGPGDPTYTPDQIRTAYGINGITFPGGLTGDAKGQSIAIVDAYNDPNIVTDLDTFDKSFSLTTGGASIYSQYGAASTFFTVYDENGHAINPAAPPSYLPDSGTSGWSLEISLDVEWAHSIAPGAKIDLVEANSAYYNDLLQTAVPTAAGLSGVSVVSMSWSSSEFSGENTLDSYFVTPSGHQGVTFFAATGDYGSPSGYPAYSPNVVAVGGTSLYLNSNNTWQSETGWGNGSSSSTLGGSGGGISGIEATPSYQQGVQSYGSRTNPDVASDADPNTGVYVVDSYDSGGPLWAVGGTSLATPTWAALVAIANQGRVSEGGVTFDATGAGPQQTLSFLYGLYKSSNYLTYFHDETSGNNGGYNAGPGYDLVTGIGSEQANALLPVLAADNLPVIAPGSLPNGLTGFAYNQTITASQGVGNKTMTIGGLPAGLTGTLSANQIIISGTPTISGIFTVTVTATDTVGDKATQTYSLTIAPAIAFNPSSLPDGYDNVLYTTQTIAASGGDGTATIVSDHVTSNPTGLSILLSSGEIAITGTPTAGGTVNFTVTAADSDSPSFTVTKAYSFYIDAPVLSYSQQPTSTVSGAIMSPALVVNVVGSVSGQPYASPVFVTLAVQSGPSGGTIVGGNPTVPTATGKATFNNLKLITCGTYTLQASVSTTSGGTSLASVNSGSFQVTASQLVITAEPSGLVAAGAPFGLTVTALDANGNVATNFNGAVTMSLASQTLVGSLGTAQLSGSVVNATNGVATFSSLSLNHLGTFTVKAGSGALIGAASTSIVVDAGKLVFTTLPGSVTSGANFQVVVSAEDLVGNVDPTFGSTVTLGINSGPAGANLQESGSAPVTATAVSGVATFANLTLDRAGTYTLSATATPPQGTIKGTSAQLIVDPSSLAFVNSTPPASVVSGHAFTVQVQATDVTGVASSFTGQATLAVAIGPGGIRGTTTANFVNGIATFSVILDHFGNYTLTASVPNGGPSINSGTVTVTADAFAIISSTSVMAGRPATVRIAAVDDQGNVATNFVGPVSVSLYSKPFRGVMTGNLTPTFANGVITLTGLTFYTPGSWVFLVSSPTLSNTVTLTVPGTVAA